MTCKINFEEYLRYYEERMKKTRLRQREMDRMNKIRQILTIQKFSK